MLGSLRGEKGQSLRINIDVNSPWFLSGKDFESGDGIGGITKVLKEGRGWSLQETAQHFESYLSKDYVAPPENIVKPNNSPENFMVTKTTATNGFIKPEIKAPKTSIGPSTPHDGEYIYTDEHGEVIVTVRRYFAKDETGEVVRDESGKPKKQFRQFMDGRQGVPEPRPMYNIPHMVEATKVIWVEGEKCAEALREMGYVATCNIGGSNDDAGKKLARIVEAQAKEAGAKSTLTLQIPATKPEKWDAADAVDEGFDVNKFIKSQESKIKKPINLLDNSLLINEYFVGAAPQQRFLIADTMPLAVPVVFAAAGDSGKGMMTLDLAMKVASGASMQNSFGGLVAEHGDAIIFTAEDDKDEVHRRISRLDPRGLRKEYQYNLRILPLPNLGGVFPVMQKFDNSFEMGHEFSRIYDQMMEMENLKLIVIDPLASFVHADVNADPAAGAAFMGLLAQMATEIGATVMVNHHMAKIKDNEPITTPEQARNLIRGTSAIVDGVRAAFSVWPVDEGTARSRCRDLQVTYSRNTVFDGAVVKSNGPANREIRHFIRNENSGLLEDRSDDVRSLQMSSTVRDRMKHIIDFVQMREDQGLAVTLGGMHDGIYQVAQSLEQIEPCVIAITQAGATTVKETTKMAMQQGRLGKFKLTPTGPEKWIGTMSGLLAQGAYIASTARDNV